MKKLVLVLLTFLAGCSQLQKAGINIPGLIPGGGSALSSSPDDLVLANKDTGPLVVFHSDGSISVAKPAQLDETAKEFLIAVAKAWPAVCGGAKGVPSPSPVATPAPSK